MAQQNDETWYYEADTLLLEIGSGLMPLVDKEKGAELLERIQNLRRQIAEELGLIIPIIRIVDNNLKPSEYCIKLKGIEAGRFILNMGHCLCIDPGTDTKKIKGIKTKEPAFGLPAIWIDQKKRDKAKSDGYTVVDPPAIITTHLSEIIKRNAVDILGLQETQNILDKLRDKYPTVVEEATKEGSGLGAVQIWKILQGLLREKVSIRNMPTILEAIAEYASLTKDIRFLTEKVRQALAKQICSQYADENRTLHVMTLDTAFEQKILDHKYQNPVTGEIFSTLEPTLHDSWIKALRKSVKSSYDKGFDPVILCSTQARYLVKTALEREFSEVNVLSVAEIANDFNVEATGTIRPDIPKDLDPEGGNTKDVHEYTQAAKQGNAKTQLKLGDCYDKGECVPKDPEKAAYLWTLSAEQGDTEAMYSLSNYFFMRIEKRLQITKTSKTERFKTDIDGDQYMAEYWCTKAAEQGHVAAQCILGAYYTLSEHGPKNSARSAYWYNKAANQGHCEAQFLLGSCYYEGEGVQKDLDKAAYWWSLAAAQGHNEAEKKFENIANSLLIYHSMNDQHGTLKTWK